MHSIPQHKMMEHLRICKGVNTDLTFSSNTPVFSSVNLKKSIRAVKTAASTRYTARAADIYEPKDVIVSSETFEPSYQSVKDLEAQAVDEEVVQETANLPCSNCNRKFMEQDRLDKHYAICSKSKKSRKVFDTVKARVIGTDMEKYALNPSKPDKKVVQLYKH
jgi:hypothetical protein